MRIAFPTLFVAFLILATAGCARSHRSAEEAEHEVLSTDDARIQARTHGDTQVLGRIYADDYTLITAEGALRTKEDQINEIRAGQLQFKPVETLEKSVRLYDNAAIVLARERSTIIRNGQDIGGDFRVNRVYVKRDGQWQLVLTHATRVAP
ncbi:MAG: nuclear transport factor 2 family protein [Chthoniobacterales bacterium]|nr:nuclear transport factor 2 family protein [Chthoniobacterales bacterium]